MMKVTKRLLLKVMLFCMILTGSIFLPEEHTQATAKKTAANTVGNYTYYAQQGTIYRLDNHSGATKKIKSIAKTNTITDVIYYKGYLYFTVDYFYCLRGTATSCNYVCRIKTNGTCFKKLSPGASPIIYNGKIYYVRMTTHILDDGDKETLLHSISQMNLNGSRKKLLLTLNTEEYFAGFQIVNDKIYYIMDGAVCQMTLKGKNISKIVSGNINHLYSDNNYLYIVALGDGIYTYAPSANTIDKIFTDTNNIDIIGVADSYIYYMKSKTLYKYNFHKATSTKIRKLANSFYDIVCANKKWMIFTHEVTYSDNAPYNIAIAKMKLNGTNYEILEKYYRP